MDWLASLRIFYESLRLALMSLRSNKLRTFLTVLGIVVGVTAVIAVTTIIGGLDQAVANTFSDQGSTVFRIAKRPMMIRSRQDAIKYNYRRDVTREDAEALRRTCLACWLVGLSSEHGSTVKFSDKTAESVRTRGLSAEMFEIEAIDLSAGRYWSTSEEESGARVAIIGSDLAENLFGGRAVKDVIGEDIRVDGKTLHVIGTATSLGKILGFSRDNFVYIPFSVAEKFYGSRGSISVNVRVKSPADFEAAMDEARSVIRSRRTVPIGAEDDGASIESQDAFVNMYRSATSGIYSATIGIAAISLIVGGIVVMNIMLVTVTERATEIGLRKAVGARGHDIMWQFIIEALTVTLAGGGIGVIVGYAAGLLLAYWMGFPVLFKTSSAVLGFTVSLVVGLASGIYPAWKASSMNPVEAMRREL